MKTVVSQSEVAHLWANKVQDHARNAGSTLYFDGNTIYSYGRHFPIAVHHNGVVLFTTRSYSNTTAKHIRTVGYACSHIRNIMCKNPDEAALGIHRNNIQSWIDEAMAAQKKLAKAKKPAIWLSEINSVSHVVAVYCEFFGVALTQEQQDVLVIQNEEKYIALCKEQQAKENERKAAFFELGRIESAKHLRAWKVCEEYECETSEKARALADYDYQVQNRNVTHLRINNGMVETSKGVKLEIYRAKRYYEFYKQIVAKGGCSGVGNCNYKMMQYDVTEISADRLVVGCHNIAVSEINEIAEKLGW